LLAPGVAGKGIKITFVESLEGSPIGRSEKRWHTVTTEKYGRFGETHVHVCTVQGKAQLVAGGWLLINRTADDLSVGCQAFGISIPVVARGA
jgi:hypothetical protein